MELQSEENGEKISIDHKGTTLGRSNCYNQRRREREEREKEESRKEREKEESREEVEVNEDFDLEFELEDLDLSNIDPVEEFGFLVMGHEFDKYPNGLIRPMKKWNWYLDAPKENTDNSDSELDDFTHEASTSKSKSSIRSKKRGKVGAGDEDWTGESDEDKDLIAKNSTSLKRSKYATRSKDSKKPRKETVTDEEDIGVQDEEIDENDETLGGFIVTGEEEEEINNEEDDEEEFEDEEYED